MRRLLDDASLIFHLTNCMEPALSALAHDQTVHADLNPPQPQVSFDPAIHLAFNANDIERVTMSSLGLDPGIALTNFAYSQPPLSSALARGRAPGPRRADPPRGATEVPLGD
jgi:hypothetical protein